MLEKLHKDLRIDARKPPASMSDIRRLQDAIRVSIPSDYLELASEATDAEILVGGRGYIRIWSPIRCIEMNGAYQIQDRIPNSLAIGDDEGGSALIMMEGRQGYGLYKVGFGDLAADGAEFVASTLRNLLTEGAGANVVK